MTSFMKSTYKKIRLKNGLRILLVPRKETAVFTALAVFGVGSRNEPENLAGISHLLEHMAYKGTKKRPTTKAVAEFVDSLGGEHNAFTEKEYTGYYVKAASEHLAKAIEFLSDNISNALILKPELERERRVLLEEIKMYEDIPQAKVAEIFEEAAFGQEGLGRRIVGYSRVIESISREEMLAYKKSHYCYQNGVLAIAGNFSQTSEKKLLKMIENSFHLVETKKEPTLQIILPAKFAPAVLAKKTEQSNIIVGFIGPSLSHSDWYAVKILTRILGGSMSSRMFLEVREKLGLAYNIATEFKSYSDIGLIGTYAGVSHKNVYKALAAICKQYQKTTSNYVDASELTRAKEMLKGRLLIDLEDSEELACEYAFDELILNRIETPEELVASYEKVTREDILACAKKYFKMNKVIVAAVGPEIDREKIKFLISN